MFQWYSMVKSQTGEVEERMGNEEESKTFNWNFYFFINKMQSFM